MNIEDLKNIVKNIVVQADELKRTLINESAPVNYACIFCQNDDEYASFLNIAKQLGTVVQETKAGPVFHIEPIQTVAGDLRLLKIRKPDPNRPERGDADFTLSDYTSFKSAHLGNSGFKLIERDDFEMIEYTFPNTDVLIYFSNPTLAEVLGIK